MEKKKDRSCRKQPKDKSTDEHPRQLEQFGEKALQEQWQKDTIFCGML